MRLRRIVLCFWFLCVILTSALAQTITSGPGNRTFSIGQIQVALTATGGTGIYTWALISGSLPPGISLLTDTPSFFPAGTHRPARRNWRNKLHFASSGGYVNGDRETCELS